MEGRIASLEEKLENSLGLIVLLSMLVTSVQTCVGDLKDAVMEESDAKGEVVSLSSSSTDMELVENLVAIPVPAPSIIHTLVPVKFLLEYIPLSLHSTPSPPYVQAREDDPLHNGVPEYWVNPE